MPSSGAAGRSLRAKAGDSDRSQDARVLGDRFDLFVTNLFDYFLVCLCSPWRNFHASPFFPSQILESLDADPYCRKLSLAHRLQSIGYILESYSHAGPVAPMPPLQLAGQLSEL